MLLGFCLIGLGGRVGGLFLMLGLGFLCGSLLDAFVFFWVASAFCFWFICVAPVRGGSYFLCRRKESNQRKRLQPSVPARITLRHTLSELSRCMRFTPG